MKIPEKFRPEQTIKETARMVLLIIVLTFMFIVGIKYFPMVLGITIVSIIMLVTIYLAFAPVKREPKYGED